MGVPLEVPSLKPCRLQQGDDAVTSLGDFYGLCYSWPCGSGLVSNWCRDEIGQDVRACEIQAPFSEINTGTTPIPLGLHTPRGGG